MKERANIWIRYTEKTGSKKPWEVCWQVPGHRLWVPSSCTTEAAAIKSVERAIRLSSNSYDIEFLGVIGRAA
jgi:hypothetical protein